MRYYWEKVRPKRITAWTERPCRECGGTFTPTQTPGRQGPPNTVFCSDICAKRAADRSGCKGDHRKRARKYGVPYEPVNKRRVYDRDGYVCQICMEPTDPTADPLSDWYPSLDHILPMSKGGAHSYGNVQTAHRWCNAVKQDDEEFTWDAA